MLLHLFLLPIQGDDVLPFVFFHLPVDFPLNVFPGPSCRAFPLTPQIARLARKFSMEAEGRFCHDDEPTTFGAYGMQVG
jgi:hypothetical protein